jgi:hypothetical protein
MALSRVCQQIRAEFQPLCMSALQIDVNLCDLEAFISTLSSAPAPGVLTSPPQNIGVYVQASDTTTINTVGQLDMRPFFLTRTCTPMPTWSIRSVISWLVASIPTVEFAQSLDMPTRMMGRDFLDAVASGFISDVIFENRFCLPHGWIVTLTKAEGSGLTRQEILSTSEDCGLLAQYGSNSLYADVTLKAVDG